MKKILITSPDFEGEVLLLYTPDDCLMTLDFRNASLSDHQLEYIKQYTPIKYPEVLAEAYPTDKLVLIEGKYAVSFEQWWNEYDKKINRKRCENKWKRMSDTDRLAAFIGTRRYKEYLKREHWRTQADPDTYLTQEYWLTEWNKQ